MSLSLLAAAMLPAAGCADDAAARPGLLAIYAETSLLTLHGHPLGQEGRELDRLEAAYNRERNRVAERLVALCGRAAVDKVDQDLLDEVQEVVFVRGPTLEEEYDNLDRARRALGRLKHRLKREERA